MKNAIIKSLLVLCCLSALTGCSNIVNHFAFYPDNRHIIPKEKLPPAVEEVFITTADHETLQAYYVENAASDQVMVFFHGNAGNICYRLTDILTMRNCGINVLAVSYRGYGKSSGRPSEKGIYVDGAAAVDYAVNTLGFSLENIIIFGRSIGTTVAVNTSQNQPFAGLILVTPLTSAKEHAKAHGLGLFAFLAGNAFDNLSKIADITCPLLVIHGTDDRVLPVSMGQKIYDRAPLKKQLVVIEGADHNNLAQVNPKKYWGAVSAFIESVDRRKTDVKHINSKQTGFLSEREK